VFWTARTVFEEGATDESEIIATMVYAAWDGGPWELAKNGELCERFQREFPQEHEEFELLRVANGVSVLRPKIVVTDVIR
jgi:hypothetical protein